MPTISRITAVSDSLTAMAPGNWVHVLATRHPDISFAAEAHGGWSTKSYFKAKFDGIAFAGIAPDADLFILLLGSNNLFEARGGNDTAVQEAVDGIVRIAEHVLGISPGAEILLAAPPTVALKNNTSHMVEPGERFISDDSPFFLGRLAHAYRELAAEHDWAFVDLFPVLTEDDFLDAAHPNAEGNRKIADAMEVGLAPWLG